MSPFLPRNRGETTERQACGLAQAYEKEDQPEGLNAQADQVLSWLEQNRPAFRTVCFADRSPNQTYCFGVGVAAAPPGVGVASPLRASLRASLCV